MLVEDDAYLAAAMAAVLEDEGYVVEVVARPREALRLLEEANPPHLVLLDWRMPEMSGADFLEALQSRRLDVPVLLCTGSPRSVTGLSPAAYSNVRGVLGKPFELEILIAEVQRACAPSAL